jgi:hypothetical protein
MKLVLSALAAAAALFQVSQAQAQVTIDMTKVSCADYLAMHGPEAGDFAAWMSGWFNQKHGSTQVNLKGLSMNIASVEKWCASNPKELIMGALQQSVEAAKSAPPAKGGGAVVVDVAKISCKQMMTADVDVMLPVAAWIGGYLSSTKNLSTIDSQYVERNTKAIAAQCKKRPKDMVLATAQKVWK